MWLTAFLRLWSTSLSLQTTATPTQGLPPPDQTLTTVLFTFLGEKLSAVLPSSDHFAWDLPKELHDQSDVVCPPPHTSQREQARFSITACTHTSTQLAVWDWHTLLPWSTAWTHSQMDGLVDPIISRITFPTNKFGVFKASQLTAGVHFCLLAAFVCPSPTSSLASATSSVEELPGIFSRERKVPRNTAQQLYDVGYVVYRGERVERGEE